MQGTRPGFGGAGMTRFDATFRRIAGTGACTDPCLVRPRSVPASCPGGDCKGDQPNTELPLASRVAGGRHQVNGVRYRLDVRLTPADVGRRVVIPLRPPGPGHTQRRTDGLGLLERADAETFAVRARDGTLVVIPARRALARTMVPPPRRHRRAGPKPP